MLVMKMLTLFLSYNADVYLGWIGWAAGSFSPTPSSGDEIPLTPYYSGGVWTDQPILVNCVAGKFH
jgi:endoglucanase